MQDVIVHSQYILLVCAEVLKMQILIKALLRMRYFIKTVVRYLNKNKLNTLISTKKSH